MEAIEGLSRELTIVMIAHRLSTVAGCDRIIELKLDSLPTASRGYKNSIKV